MEEMHHVSHFVLIYASPMNASVNLCANSFLLEMARQQEIEYRAVPIHSIKASDIAWSDVVVVGRLCFPEEYELFRKIKATGRKILYVLDDDLLNIPNNIGSFEVFSDEKIKKTVLAFINSADGLISPSPILLAKYGKGKNNILIEEPAIDFFNPKRPGAVINIGFAGSKDRTEDVEDMLADVLIKLYKHYNNKIQFYFMGVKPNCSREISGIEIDYIGNYDEYRHRINNLRLDIGLAPMPKSSFHSCKHYNKFIEYSSLGIVGVYSNVLPYSQLKKKEAPIILVDNNPDDWYEKISALIEDPELLYDLKLRCYKFAKKNFNIQRIVEDIKKQSLEVFSFNVPNSKINALVPKHFSHTLMFYKFCRGLKKYGVKLPLVAIKRISTMS